MCKSMYQLTADYEAVLQMLYDGDADEQAIFDTLEAIEGAMEDKADGYAIMIRTIDKDVKGIDEEIRRLQSRKQVLTNRANRLKSTLEMSMRATGRTRFDTILFSFKIQKNGGKRALVLDCPADNLPPNLQKVTVTPDNAAIRKLLEQDDVEVNQYAHLAPQGESLRIS